MSEFSSATLVTDDNDLGGFTTCAICTRQARVFDGPAALFTRPTRVICALCLRAIKNAT